MNRIYLDNAATTPLDKEVLDAMLPYMTTKFGNPSSVYSYGRESRLAIETARKTVAKLLGAQAGEIIFTSCGTESNNMAILAAVRDLGCRHIISSRIEHHAVLHTVEHYGAKEGMSYSFVEPDAGGHISLSDLEKQLTLVKKPCLVSLMHANNETGNLLHLEGTAHLCKQYGAVFHSDCVQTVGHYPINLEKIPVNFISGSAHKFHGPKGAGILYVNKSIVINPLIWGGGQERNKRAGTENVYGIVGFATALELAMKRYANDQPYILSLKNYMMEQLSVIPDIRFNGDAGNNSLYTVLNVSFPKNESSDMLLLHLDTKGICASGGSACSSGGGSHVIKALGNDVNRTAIRFSFSRYNTKEEIDSVIATLAHYLQYSKNAIRFTVDAE